MATPPAKDSAQDDSDRRRAAAAVAMRLDCPIFVDEEVLKSSKLAATISDRASNEELRKLLENMNDEDFGRYKM